MKLEDIAKMAIDEVEAELKEISAIPAPIQTQKTATAQISENASVLSGEEIFLRNLKERVLVLFEGLNATPKESLEDRLDLTLRFLEFVLANVENRLENLKTK